MKIGFKKKNKYTRNKIIAEAYKKGIEEGIKNVNPNIANAVSHSVREAEKIVQKEKLMQLFEDCVIKCNKSSCVRSDCTRCAYEQIAEYLTENGVRVADATLRGI